MRLQASLRKTIRAIEKQQVKFHKQAQEWSQYQAVQSFGSEAHRAGLAGIKGQLDLVRAFREVHTQEIRQELALYEAVSAVPCCAVLCSAMLCCAMLCHAVPCCAVPCCAVLCCTY